MGCNIPYAEVRISKVGAQLKNVKYQLLAPSRQETALQHCSTFLGCILGLLVSLQQRPWWMLQSELSLHSSPNFPTPGAGSLQVSSTQT